MILDWKNNPDHAAQYDILDAATFQPLPMEPPWRDVFYADDSRGVLRFLKLDAQGNPYLIHRDDPGRPVEPWSRARAARGDKGDPDLILAWQEVRRGILIVRKP